MKISKIYLRVCSLLFACFLVCGSILRPVVTYASPYDLMINTDSNALMTMELNDDDYVITPFSSIVSINNTVNYSYVDLYIRLIDAESGMRLYEFPNIIDDSGNFIYRVPSGYELDAYGWRLKHGSLPSPGKYIFQLDFSSDISVNYSSYSVVYNYKKDNVALQDKSVNVRSFTQNNSGDLYSNFVLDLGYIDDFRFICGLNDSLKFGSVFAGNIKFSFSSTSADSDVSISFSDDFEGDYQYDVSSSLSDLSSSVESMTEDLSSAAENLEYISTSQNLIIQGIDNVVMHISDQLFAFWNQLYNLIHVPTMAKMDDIISAINNMDLEIEVNLDGLKTTINNMSTAVQNKLQSITDKITGGYDNSGITQENEKLEQSINQYDEVESGIFEDAEGFIGDFEYPSVDSLPLGIIKALAFVGSFLQGVFLSMSEFSVIITFSLTMIFVMVVVGYHRIRS